MRGVLPMKNQKRTERLLYILIILAILILCVSLVESKIARAWLRVHTTSIQGVYVASIGAIVCDQESACIHEVGHWVDKKLGYPSFTESFQKAVGTYLDNCKHFENYCSLRVFPGVYGNELLDTNWGGYTEAYAQIYSLNHYDGWELPEVFVEFYQ